MKTLILLIGTVAWLGSVLVVKGQKMQADGEVGRPSPFPTLDTLRYGAAYYYEYMPRERLDEDVRLMKEAGINTVRIAESTWGVWEPRDGVFDWTQLDRVLDAMERGGIGVIIGTPTYAIPAWLVREHPEVLVVTNAGRRPYGARQNMDIVSPVFRGYAERIIRQLVTHVRGRRCVIGYQVDNETKSYGNVGAPMQTLFVQWLRQRFGTPAAMTRAYGLNYWGNSIHDWADMPSIAGNINASLGCADAFFQRKMVTDYLAWQVKIIRTLKRPDQFITHNFDLEWRTSSYGIQPDVDHFAAARAMDVAGIDIYHPTENRLTGSEIAFGGDLARSMRRTNYLVMETQAQSLAGRQEGMAGVRPGRDWLDTDGHPIDAHGAGVLFHDGMYYLFGEIKKGRTRLVPGQSWEDYRVNAGGVSCYSSRDLVHWTYKGIALAPNSTDTASDLHISKVIERPKVIYNETTRQFVMWMHIDKNDYGYARAGAAVSDSPQGPYRYLGSVRPNGQMSRDMTVFRDDDGRAWLAYASENNNTMQVCLLSKDYLSPTRVYQRILIGQRREAPAIFKSGGRYYLITSLCSGWDPNPARIAVADSMMGTWVQEGNPCVGKDSATTFSSQSTYVLPLAGDSFMFMADRWNKTDLEHSGYLWLPFRVEGGRVEIKDEEGGHSAQAHADTGLGSKAQQADSQRVVIGPLSLISYDVKLKSGYSFLRCYDSAHHLLLEYQSKGGNYTETPPGTAYVVIGATGGAIDWMIEPNIGETGVRHVPLCNLRQYLQPFWLSDTVYNETVLLYSTAGGAAEGRCLYRPDKILSVRNFSLDTIYHQGTDYILHDRTLTRMPGSLMPFRADTSFDKKDLAWYNLQSQWVVVTYTHHDKWDGPTPSYQGEKLPRLTQLLHSGRPVSVVAYGMSITRGLDVSGYDRVAPYMPTYMELFVQGLRWRYPHSPVTLHNAGLPGSTVDWGARYAEYYIPPLNPDLVVIDFGMNDFWRMPPAEFGDSIRTIIRKVRSADPAAEFLLLGNMTFDPAYVLDSDSAKAFYTGNLAGYAGELRKLEGKGVVMLDMTNISKAIYQRKKAKDCIVNPLHPNDFMARWYAQGMVEVVAGESLRRLQKR